MSDPKRYTIRTVHDFVQVPEDRRAICLKEFQVWIAMAENVDALLGGIKIKPPKAFVWIDDDKHEIDVSIETPTERMLLVSGRMKAFPRTTPPADAAQEKP